VAGKEQLYCGRQGRAVLWQARISCIVAGKEQLYCGRQGTAVLWQVRNSCIVAGKEQKTPLILPTTMFSNTNTLVMS